MDILGYYNKRKVGSMYMYPGVDLVAVYSVDVFVLVYYYMYLRMY